MDEPDLPEYMCKALIAAAVLEGRESDLINCLMQGGSATVDAQTHKLVLVTAEQLNAMFAGLTDD